MDWVTAVYVCMSGAIFSKADGPIKKCYCKELSQIAQGSKWAKKIAKKLPKSPNWQKVAKMQKTPIGPQRHVAKPADAKVGEV